MSSRSIRRGGVRAAGLGALMAVKADFFPNQEKTEA